jgi:hypothetical protein
MSSVVRTAATAGSAITRVATAIVPSARGGGTRLARRARGRPAAGRLLPPRFQTARRDRPDRPPEQGGGIRSAVPCGIKDAAHDRGRFCKLSRIASSTCFQAGSSVIPSIRKSSVRRPPFSNGLLPSISRRACTPERRQLHTIGTQHCASSSPHRVVVRLQPSSPNPILPRWPTDTVARRSALDGRDRLVCSRLRRPADQNGGDGRAAVAGQRSRRATPLRIAIIVTVNMKAPAPIAASMSVTRRSWVRVSRVPPQPQPVALPMTARAT